jgi:uncharacterized protein (DUF58 family)
MAKTTAYPIEVVTNLDDLMRFEYLIRSERILPDRPIYSILSGRHYAKMRGRGLDFEEVRQYVPGDDVRNIDWKVTARNTETYSKVFNEEKERPTFTIVDQSSTMFFGSKLYVKSVTAAHVAALTAFYTIKRGDRFGGLIFNEEGYDYVAPKRNKALVEHFLQLIVNRNAVLPQRKIVKPDSDLLNDMLQRTQAFVTHDYVITLITDLLLLNETGYRLLRNLAYHNDVILVHTEDPADKVLPSGKTVLTDGERQVVWNNNKKNNGEKYTNDYESRLTAITEDMRHYGIMTSIMKTDMPVEDQIKDNIGKRLRK